MTRPSEHPDAEAPRHTRPPVVGAEVWTPVVQAAGYRCQCTGECGSPHRKDPDGRCMHSNSPGRPLHAAPPGAVSTTEAARLPASQLRAYCPLCHTGKTRATARAATAEPTESLF